MPRNARRTILSVLLSLCSSPALAAPADDLKTTIDTYWEWSLKTDPLLASLSGDRRYDAEVPDISLAAQDRQAAQARAFVKQLDAVPEAGLSAPDRLDRAILRRLLSEQAEANDYPERMILFSTLYNWHQQFADLADGLPFDTRRDYDNYLARLEKYPRINQQVIAISREAIKQGVVLPCSALGDFDKPIAGMIVGDPEKSRNYAPFAGDAPSFVPAAEWQGLRERARQIVVTVLNPEHRQLLDFVRKEYLPRCRKADGMSAMPQGRAFYAYRARVMTTTDMTPEAIHALGLKEVARIRSEMEALTKQAGYANREAFVATLRSDPRYYTKSPEELLAATAFVAKTIDGKLPRLFGKLPRLPYGVRAIPADSQEGNTAAYYMPGSPDGGISGTYYVNTWKLDQRPLWELPALTAHESVPGHHLQIALQQEMELRPFRRYAADFTAFIEGWGLYAEHLGIEMGLYDTPEKTMGRLSYEMWRACRLVVDTGIHTKGWTKAKAIAFMKDNTALSDANIEAEVNRYISYPGQALAYKLGELKFKELRTRAEAALGDRFDVRRFHDAVLGQGPLPLDLLDQHMTEWIAAEKLSAAKSQ